MNETVSAVNALTTRWARRTRQGTVFSAAGVWPLLAFLADGAAGPARDQLTRALGIQADQAAAGARELLTGLDAMAGVGSALGLWTDRALELHERWAAGLPADAHGVLGPDPAASQEALDAWAAKRTDGLVERIPVQPAEGARLVLATALALRTDWQHPFRETVLRPGAGPWQGRTLAGLHRSSVRPDRIGVSTGPDGRVTTLKVLGDNGLDVHLVLGDEGMAPGQVLHTGIGALERVLPTTTGGQLPYGPAGPGVVVERQPSVAPDPMRLDATTPGFVVRADHDLLQLHGLFGLSTAANAREGHFPGISAAPLSIGAAGQSAVAEFGPLGFRAAAVTAVLAAPGGGPPQYRYESTVVRAAFDRPFGFLAVHRETRLVLVAGWVTDPTVVG